MRIRYEFINFFTGIILVLAGLVQFWYRQIEEGMNWTIFGSMYLVMDDYIPKQHPKYFSERLLDIGRKIFSWVGLLLSLYLVYHLVAVHGALSL